VAQDNREKQVPSPDLLDDERQAKAQKYASIRRRLSIVEVIVAMPLFVWLLLSGIFKDIAETLSLATVPQAVVFFIILLTAYLILTFPLNVYRGYVLPKRYGLSIQNLIGWLKDYIKIPLIMILLGSGIIALLYWFLDGWTDIWWLLALGLLMIISLALSVLAPIIIIPLFYTMRPLEDESLKKRFVTLAAKADAAISGIYLMDFSSRSTGANAVMMGAGSTRRIALSDTLLKDYSTEEIDVIIAHELGHYKNHDTWRIFIIQGLLMALILWLTDVITRAMLGNFDLASISEVAAMPLLAVVFAVIGSLMTPITNLFVRRREKAADDYALKLTDNPEGFISMMSKITDQNLDEARPNKLIEALLYDHPSWQNRVVGAKDYLARREKGDK
jgi:STE24 endopeptidase